MFSIEQWMCVIASLKIMTGWSCKVFKKDKKRILQVQSSTSFWNSETRLLILLLEKTSLNFSTMLPQFLNMKEVASSEIYCESDWCEKNYNFYQNLQTFVPARNLFSGKGTHKASLTLTIFPVKCITADGLSLCAFHASENSDSPCTFKFFVLKYIPPFIQGLQMTIIHHVMVWLKCKIYFYANRIRTKTSVKVISSVCFYLFFTVTFTEDGLFVFHSLDLLCEKHMFFSFRVLIFLQEVQKV